MLRRLVANTGSNLMLMLVSMVVTFIMAPIYLRMLGHHDYGLREMIMALVGYMGILDLGLRPTVSRFAASLNAVSDHEGMKKVYASSFFFLGLVGLSIGAFFAVWALTFPSVLNPEGADETTKYTLFLLFIAIQIVFLFPQHVAESYLEGLQLYYLKNLINMIFSVGTAISVYTMITPDNGLLLLTGFVAFATFLKLIIFTGILFRPAHGRLFPSPGWFSVSHLRELFTFGIKSMVQGAAHKVETLSDKLVLGTILGPAVVPTYTIPATLVEYLRNFFSTLTHAFMPFFSDLDARGERDRILSIYLTASKLVVGLLFPMAVGLCIIASPFIDIWMNGEFDPGIVDGIVLLLVVKAVTSRLDPFGSRYLTAINQHGIYAKLLPVAALMNLLLSIWFVVELGIIGAAMGSVLPVFLFLPFFLRKVTGSLGISVAHYLRVCVLPAVVPALIMGLLITYVRVSDGMETYLGIVLSVGLGALVYMPIFWFVSCSTTERRMLVGHAGRVVGSHG